MSLYIFIVLNFLVNLISFAYADSSTSQESEVAQNSLFSSILPLLLIMGVFYFLLLRPQQKKLKEHQGMLSKLERGDQVVTSGGLLGTIYKIDEEIVTIEIAPEVKAKFRKETITEILKSDKKVDKNNKNQAIKSNKHGAKEEEKKKAIVQHEKSEENIN